MKRNKYYEKRFEKYYKNIDDSHNYKHIIKVVHWCYKIIDHEKNLTHTDKKIIIISAYLHDAYDSKYYNKKEQIEKIKKISKDLYDMGISRNEQEIIFTIIDNISFTKEQNKRMQGIQIDLGPIQLLRDIVSDADKLESLGEEGIKRMVQYEKYNLGYKDKKASKMLNSHLKHIYELYDTRLSILIKENYIHTKYARKKAKKLLKELSEIINNDLKLIDIVLKYM